MAKNILYNAENGGDGYEVLYSDSENKSFKAKLQGLKPFYDAVQPNMELYRYAIVWSGRVLRASTNYGNFVSMSATAGGVPLGFFVNLARINENTNLIFQVRLDNGEVTDKTTTVDTSGIMFVKLY